MEKVVWDVVDLSAAIVWEVLNEVVSEMVGAVVGETWGEASCAITSEVTSEVTRVVMSKEGQALSQVARGDAQGTSKKSQALSQVARGDAQGTSRDSQALGQVAGGDAQGTSGVQGAPGGGGRGARTRWARGDEGSKPAAAARTRSVQNHQVTREELQPPPDSPAFREAIGRKPQGIHGWWSGESEALGGTGIEMFSKIYRDVDGVWGAGAPAGGRGVPEDVRVAMQHLRALPPPNGREAFPAFPPAPALVPLDEQAAPTSMQTREAWLLAVIAVRRVKLDIATDGETARLLEVAAQAVTLLWQEYASIAAKEGGRVLGRHRSAPGQAAHDATAPGDQREDVAGGDSRETWKEGFPDGAVDEAPDVAVAGEPKPWFNATGGKLKPKAWQARGTAGRLLKDISEVEFAVTEEVKINLHLPNLPSCAANLEAVLEEIHKYDKKGVIEWQPDDGTEPGTQQVPDLAFVTVINPWGATEKKGSADVRPYVDCSRSGVNASMAGWGVKYPSVDHALQAAHAGGYVAKRDWEASFHHVRLTEQSRKYTGFRHPVSGRVGRFKVLPFGISQCPGRFWDIANEFMRIAAEELARRGLLGVSLVGYVDDLLIMALTHAEIVAAFACLDELGEELGVSWKPAKDEGQKEPLQRVTFVGIAIDVTAEPTLLIDSAKRGKYLAQVRKVLSEVRGTGKVAREDVRTMVGQLAFTARACRWGRVYIGAMYSWQDGPGWWVHGFDEGVEEELSFWEELLDESSGWEGRTRWCAARWDLVKNSHYFEQGGDAAGEENMGWAAVFGYERAAGDFTAEELLLHIAWKELIAVVRGFELWVGDYKDHRVVVWTDNISVAAAINAGTTGDPVGRRILKRLAMLAVRHGVEVRAKHIKGKLNVTADKLSRKQAKPSSADYKLNPEVFDEAWGPHRPELDMYCDVGGRNAQERRDVGRGTDFFSVARQATLSDLVSRKIWFNPPWALVGQALELVERAWKQDPTGTMAYGVIPIYRNRWWWSRFVGGRRAPFRIVRQFPARTHGLFLCTGARAFRVEGGHAPPAGGTPFELALVAIGRLQ